MAEQRKSSGGQPAGWSEKDKAQNAVPGADPDGAGDADTAGKPSDDRMATEMAAALIESENGDSDEEAPSDTEAPRNPA